MTQLSHKFPGIIFLAILAIVFVGCENNDEDPNAELQARLDAQKIEIEDYLAENNINTDEVNGYYLETITENPDGRAPATNNVVAIYYELSTLDGQLIEKLEEAAGDAPAKFLFNQQQIILPIALSDIISNMHKGEEVRAYLPFSIAYQGLSLGNTLSAYSAIIMKVKLAEVLSEAEQRLAEDAQIKAYLAENGLQNADSLARGVYYIETAAGSEPEVESTSRVGLRYKGTFLDGTEFDSNMDTGDPIFTLTLGQNPQQAIPGFETAVGEMSLNEEGTTLIPSHEAYGTSLFAAPYELMEDLVNQGYGRPAYIAIKPYSILRFDLEVEGIN
ncbi:FKBP-type peptidyl-prolyl cis-trans isomerase [Catalinimonas niigatensis]|uniref:FKBP-type peptidyl-prolyl cis-trans isomerase n=1 Tax=Catalinimonas niigatensis TaxID=1397264 RepID=UPI0026652D67|nr:FKBP-type peptidyl-prolyl cis-trans isomerase [Catalinimonas niigatensis]WPP48395.1 FKBP-type peptidyl-prolyl cis-trans isomerase [Catalinimonas niigatensis]